jgi:hypothetical protein
MSSQDIEKTIRAIMFDGKQANWIVWSAKFGAKGVKQGYYALLFGTDADVRVPKKSEEDQHYYEWEPDGQGNLIQVRIFTKTQWLLLPKRIFKPLWTCC